MVDRWRSPPGLLGWKQRLEPLPWRVGEVSSVPRTPSHTEHGRDGKDALVRAIVNTTDQVVEHVIALGKLLVDPVGHYYGDDIRYMGSEGRRLQTACLSLSNASISSTGKRCRGFLCDGSWATLFSLPILARHEMA